MLDSSSSSRQGSFYDPEFICDQLIPPDSFYRQFKEKVARLITDRMFESMYCLDNGRPPISPALLAKATVLQFHRNLSDRKGVNFLIEYRFASMLLPSFISSQLILPFECLFPIVLSAKLRLIS